jgi:hypothetical protein
MPMWFTPMEWWANNVQNNLTLLGARPCSPKEVPKTVYRLGLICFGVNSDSNNTNVNLSVGLGEFF